MNLRSRLLLSIVLSLSFLGCASHPEKSNLSITETQNGTWESEPSQDANGVILVPQWHLSPQTNTRSAAFEGPQKKNQQAIYNELSNWIQKKQIQSVLTEGCEGDLDAHRDVVYNGWSLNDLETMKQDKSIDDVQTHLGNKLSAKFGNKAAILCGDDLQLIKENQLALSDIRGFAGFKMRIEQPGLSAKDKEKFVSGLKSILNLPPKTKTAAALQALDVELKNSIKRFEELIQKRNDSFLSKAGNLKGRTVIVIGSLHIPDLKSKLAAQKIPVSVWTPVGLDNSDSDLIEKLKKILRI